MNIKAARIIVREFVSKWDDQKIAEVLDKKERSKLASDAANARWKNK